jgi:serine/threonine-protein kinase
MAVSDTLINTLFDGRYRILRRIGSGGMANVYVAEDEELGRRVAIKILNERYANDDLSNERFRREAKSAAALSHPNIVSIYDRGESNGIPYIAMEMIEGRSLKEVILARGPLSVSQAIEYTEQILDALRFAHRNGIIHRDIKPHNILIGPEGRLKVTDFGIARAGFSQMTEAGSIMGTAQYLSPEQARGAPVTAASDLYSVGIVLYEMVTGEVPFDGHSPIEIAMKHVNETPRPPSDVNPDVPRELDQIVLRALAKDPHDRYQTAELFSEDLERLEAGVPVSPDTAAAATAVLTGPPAPGATQVLPPDAATRTLPGRRTADRRPPYPPQYGYREPPRKRRRLVPWLLVLLLLGGAAAAGWYVFSRVREEIAESKPVAVPLVIGLRQEQAREQIEKVGLEAEVKRAPSTRQPRGRVFAQDPKVGTEVAKGTKVTLRVSTGPPMAEVPRLVGLDKDRAIEILDKRELKWNVQETFSDHPVDEVVGQKPKPGERVVEASVVTLTVSKGQEPVTVPNVVGMPRQQAEATLKANGFGVTGETVASDEDKGIVVDQDPSAGAEVPKGSTVTIEVSEGPQTTSVPDVVGQSRKDAERELGNAGFGVRVRVEATTDPAADGRIVDQNPAGGVQADPGSTVTIAVGEFVPPPTTTG